jgi:hypothetical protein
LVWHLFCYNPFQFRIGTLSEVSRGARRKAAGLFKTFGPPLCCKPLDCRAVPFYFIWALFGELRLPSIKHRFFSACRGQPMPVAAMAGQRCPPGNVKIRHAKQNGAGAFAWFKN